MKIKKGDEVKIIRGKDKGRTGTIERVVGKNKVLIPNINQYKRHIKKRLQGQKSEIVTITKPVSFANVRMICPRCRKTTRIGFEIVEGKKSRFCKKCKESI